MSQAQGAELPGRFAEGRWQQQTRRRPTLAVVNALSSQADKQQLNRVCVVDCWCGRTEQQQLLLARAPSSARGGQQQQQQQEDAEAVRGMLQDAGFTTLPIDADTTAAAEAAEQPAASSSSGAAAHGQPDRAISPAGAGRLEQVQRTIIAQERAAAATQAAAEAAAAARAAAEADARKKPYRCADVCGSGCHATHQLPVSVPCTCKHAARSTVRPRAPLSSQ